jgi:hypothetical protein
MCSSIPWFPKLDHGEYTILSNLFEIFMLKLVLFFAKDSFIFYLLLAITNLKRTNIFLTNGQLGWFDKNGLLKDL